MRKFDEKNDTTAIKSAVEASVREQMASLENAPRRSPVSSLRRSRRCARSRCLRRRSGSCASRRPATPRRSRCWTLRFRTGDLEPSYRRRVTWPACRNPSRSFVTHNESSISQRPGWTKHGESINSHSPRHHVRFVRTRRSHDHPRTRPLCRSNSQTRNFDSGSPGSWQRRRRSRTACISDRSRVSFTRSRRRSRAAVTRRPSSS
jgi:hypothetical protein